MGVAEYLQYSHCGFGLARLRGAFARAVEYVLSRQSETGWFCFYRTEFVDEPNLCDTYHAVGTLVRLGHPVPRVDRLIESLQSLSPTSQPSALYYHALTMLTLQPGYRPGAAVRHLVASLRVDDCPGDLAAVSGWLERTRMIARLKRQFGDIADLRSLPQSLARIDRSGDFGSPPNARDTWLALDILACRGHSRFASDVRAFVDSIQIPGFGFTRTPGALNPSLDAVFAGVRCCRLSGVPVRYGGDATRFLLACQVGRGGFARTPGALADIELTYRAVATLIELAAHRIPVAAIT